jgi:tetratricopeptide (TPR) repeat protein
MREADFSEETKRTLAQRVNYCCAKCGCATSGPQVAPSKALNIGVAAHITAASLGGPRYDPTLTQEARQSIENGIWLCQSCAKLIDNDTARFTTKVLQDLKAKAEADAFAAIGRAKGAEHPLIPALKAALPKADPARFSVALTHLANDQDRRIERLIVESLRTLSGVQVLVLDRTISPEGSIPEEAEREGHETARALLRVSSANVLVWGTVLSDGALEAPSLYWTTVTVGMRSQQLLVPQDLRLPKMFWDDLVLVVTLLVTTESAEFFARRGQRVAHELKPFLDRVQVLLDGTRNWNASIRNQIVFIAARAHQAIGTQTQSRQHLLKSIGLYRSALGNTTYKDTSEEWLSAKNGLGIALGALGSIETSPDALAEAAATFREILALPTSTSEAAVFQSNLGNALLKLGERENGTEKLHQAVAAYQEASRIWTKQQFPLDWATLESNLGYAFQLIGQREARRELLAASLTAYRRALEEWTRDLVPMYWASAQANLGNTLKIIGEQEAGTESIELATRAYREALGEQSVERDPLAWGEIQNNLGAALMLIADRRGDPGSLRDAVSALRESLKVRTREATPMGFASSSNNLGVALIRLGEWEDDPAPFEEAVRAFRAALDVWTAENSPHRGSIAQRNLGDALTALGKRRKRRAIL